MTKFELGAVRRHIGHHHPGCPEFAVAYIAEQVTTKDWRGASLGAAVGITMQNILRHEMTNYDTLLLTGVSRDEAKRRVQPRINAMLQIWAAPPSRHQTEN